MRRQIGTVNLLVGRVYALNDGEDPADPTVKRAYVEAGVWPVFRDRDEIYWEMTGQRSTLDGRIADYGDGLFGVSTYDVPTDEKVTVRSRKFSSVDFIDFVHNDPIVVGGRHARRLIFNMEV